MRKDKEINMTDDSSCPRCQHGLESIMHVLRDCDEAMEFWYPIIKPNNWAKFFSLGLMSWLEWNLGNEDIGNTPWSWVTFFGVSINALWKDRNEFVFNQYSILLQNWLLHLASQVQMVVESIVKPATYMQSNGSTIHIKWEPPPAGTLKFNVDGAHCRRSGFSACGGLLRDAHGSLIQGF
jgi:hypothetical protein